MVRMNIQEMKGLTTNLAVENVPDNNDVYLVLTVWSRDT